MPDKLAAHSGPDAADRPGPPDVVDAERHSGEQRPNVVSRSLGREVALAITIVVTALLGVVLAPQIADSPIGRIVAIVATSAALAALARAALRTWEGGRSGASQRAVIVGAGDVGQLVARKLLRHPEYGIDLVGFVDRPPRRWRRDVTGVPILGQADDLLSIIESRGVGRVIVAFSGTRDQDMLAAVRAAVALNVHVDVVPRMFEVIGPNTGLPHLEGLPLVSIAPRRRSAASIWVKRGIDVVGAIVGLVVLAPLFVWAAWRIPRETPGPMFFRQTRLSSNMREFTMLKFRTMKVDTDESLHHDYIDHAMNGDGSQTVDAGELYKVDRGDVVTPTGRWLRRTSLDELPQLVNVLRGEMSLVGPRPCLAYETEYFAPHHYERFLVPAGITGLWQVTARGHASFAEALEMDVAYARDWSLGLDLSLLLRTPIEVIRQRGATR